MTAMPALLALLHSTVMLLLGFLALWLTRGRGPTVQTLIGRATLSGLALLILLLPLSSRIQPIWRLPAPHQEPAPRPSPVLPLREGKELPPVGTLRDALSAFPEPSAPPPIFMPPAVSVPGTAAAHHGDAFHSAPTPPPASCPPQREGVLRSNLLYAVIAQAIRSKEVGS